MGSSVRVGSVIEYRGMKLEVLEVNKTATGDTRLQSREVGAPEDARRYSASIRQAKIVKY